MQWRVEFKWRDDHYNNWRRSVCHVWAHDWRDAVDHARIQSDAPAEQTVVTVYKLIGKEMNVSELRAGE